MPIDKTKLDKHLDPCMGVCMFESKSKYCYGCTRTLPEIAQWYKKTEDERYAIIDDYDRRKAIIKENRTAQK